MEYILKNISLNKVNIPIITNSYEEINNFIQEENLFNCIENIIDKYQLNNKSVKKYTTINSNINSNIYDKHLENFNSLILCILEIIDKSVSLLNNTTKLEKIKNFKNMMVLNLDMIKLQISSDDMKKAIDKEDNIVCIYFAFLLKKNIAIFKDNDIEIYGNFDDCIAITYDKNNKLYKICETCQEALIPNGMGPTKFFKELMIKKRIKIMLDNNIIEKLNTFLLKDLKDIADRIKLPTYKLEGNKKKNLLKNELKDIIKQKIEEYK